MSNVVVLATAEKIIPLRNADRDSVSDLISNKNMLSVK